ncbi:hypothetical protein LCGC14_2734620, partial [marine sediment metagenome]
EGHGMHRPTTDQPSAMGPSGSRFLQDDHGAGEAAEGVPTSGLNQKQKSKPIKKQASEHHTPPRFMGTSFEKCAKESDRGLGQATREHAKGVGPGAASAGKRILSSGERGATGVIDWGARTVKKGVSTVADSPGLSLLALLGGGALAAKGIGRAGKAVLRLGRRKKTPVGLLQKARKALIGK